MHDTIVKALREATINVFSTMLGVEIDCGPGCVETSSPETNDGIVSFIGVAGPWTGTGSLTCSPLMACRISSQMLMSEFESVNEDVLDAVAEVTNMIIGNVKTDLEPHLGALGLSIPTVVYGRNFKTRNAGNIEWIVVRATWQEEVMSVKMRLAPGDRASHAAYHLAGTACALEV
ncbi:MAG: chemotaxis protein CheX [Acidobacteriia bacterium]|nr:chemotaxis protein CheX [Terriglobia bacterium]